VVPILPKENLKAGRRTENPQKAAERVSPLTLGRDRE